VKEKFGVVILNRYPELAEKLIRSIRATHEEMPPILVVRDRNDATYGDDVEVIDGKVPFVFARNANLDLLHLGYKDVILCNDDCECEQEDFFWKLYDISCQDPLCGMVSPLIKGGVGCQLQMYSELDKFWRGKPKVLNSKMTLCFPCILIKRKAMNTIGYLDEKFTDYGLEDTDYCIRVFNAGFHLNVTKELYIKHGDGEPGISLGHNYSLSFARDPKPNSSLDYLYTKHDLVRQ